MTEEDMETLERIDACDEGQEWARDQPSLDEAYLSCTRGDWLAWYLASTVESDAWPILASVLRAWIGPAADPPNRISEHLGDLSCGRTVVYSTCCTIATEMGYGFEYELSDPEKPELVAQLSDLANRLRVAFPVRPCIPE